MATAIPEDEAMPAAVPGTNDEVLSPTEEVPSDDDVEAVTTDGCQERAGGGSAAVAAAADAKTSNFVNIPLPPPQPSDAVAPPVSVPPPLYLKY